jgi:hypothetical protein
MLLTTVFIISCSSLEIGRDKFPSKHDKEVFLMNMEVISQLPKYSSNPKVVNHDGFVNVLFESDTIKLDNTIEFYSCFFTSGLINPRMLGPSPNGHISIHDIIELSNPDKKLKVHKYKVRGLSTSVEDGQVIFYLNGDQWFIELTNDLPFKSHELKENILNAKLTCLIGRPMM